ncbi:Hypothetical protein ETEE_3679 [Edwardsiella anguillarum ET080813]|uniref:Uncharacterized protein n=1 Tax=Edwardsiella anguillarum ET080813 TaxID=667120 RepID=A0A076LQ51_9GAMM|nr:Hypothetical protein ETEE_3679 [Edwardsiella anguillarum ET080813]
MSHHLPLITVRGVLKTTAARQYAGHRAHLGRRQRRLQPRQQTIDPAQRHVLRRRGRHRRLQLRQVGRGAQVVLLSAVDRQPLPLRILLRPGAKAGQRQPLGQIDQEILQADRTAVRRPRAQRRHRRPAHRRRPRRHSLPDPGDPPALIGDRIRHQIVGQRRGLVDKGIDRHDQRQLCRGAQARLQQGTQPRHPVQRVRHVANPRLQPVGIGRDTRGDLLTVLATLLIVRLAARQHQAAGLDLARKALEVIARPAAKDGIGRRLGHHSSLQINIPDQHIQHQDGIGGIETVGMHGSAVGIHRRAGAVGGKLPRQRNDIRLGHPADFAVLRQGQLLRLIAQAAQRAFYPQRALCAAASTSAGGSCASTRPPSRSERRKNCPSRGCPG